jgi:hypothetical protein
MRDIQFGVYHPSWRLSIPQGIGAQEQVVRSKNVGWLDTRGGYSPTGNNQYMYARHKVTSMFFIATAELR